MIMLIKEDCFFCKEFEDVDKRHPNVFIFKVIDGMTDIGDGVMRPIDRKIESLPALMTHNAVYMKIEDIREQLKIAETSLGE